MLRARLKTVVKYWIPLFPRCFNMIGEVLSCPSALEFLLILIASFTVSGWMLISGSVGGLPSFLEVLRLSLVGGLVGGGTYWRFKRLAILVLLL